MRRAGGARCYTCLASCAKSLAALVAGVVAVPQLGSSKQQPLAGFVLGRSIGATWEAVNDPVMVRDTVCSCCQLPVLERAGITPLQLRDLSCIYSDA
eukprot:COSAG02_NODE_948_length_15709_cov_67.728700_1_plen_97_part_00